MIIDSSVCSEFYLLQRASGKSRIGMLMTNSTVGPKPLLHFYVISCKMPVIDASRGLANPVSLTKSNLQSHSNIASITEVLNIMGRAGLIIALFLASSVLCFGQFLPGQTVDVETYNNQPYLEGAGSYQRILYEDKNSTMTTNMIWSEIYVAPCGIWLPMLHPDLSEVAYIMEGDLVGCIILKDLGNTAGCQNFTAGGVVAVPANTLHSAENPGCTPVRAMQALSGGESFKQIAMISSLFAMSPSSVQYGMNLSAAQVTSSAASISPTFTVNQACLDRCGLAGAPAVG